MAKRYFCFAGDHQLAGGWGDFRGAYDSVKAAQDANPFVGRAGEGLWRQIVDIENMTVVEDTASLDQLVKDWQSH